MLNQRAGASRSPERTTHIIRETRLDDEHKAAYCVHESGHQAPAPVGTDRRDDTIVVDGSSQALSCLVESVTLVLGHRLGKQSVSAALVADVLRVAASEWQLRNERGEGSYLRILFEAIEDVIAALPEQIQNARSEAAVRSEGHPHNHAWPLLVENLLGEIPSNLRLALYLYYFARISADGVCQLAGITRAELDSLKAEISRIRSSVTGHTATHWATRREDADTGQNGRALDVP